MERRGGNAASRPPSATDERPGLRWPLGHPVTQLPTHSALWVWGRARQPQRPRSTPGRQDPQASGAVAEPGRVPHLPHPQQLARGATPPPTPLPPPRGASLKSRSLLLRLRQTLGWPPTCPVLPSLKGPPLQGDKICRNDPGSPEPSWETPEHTMGTMGTPR